MTALFPSPVLPFDALLDTIGPDPQPIPQHDGAIAYFAAKQAARMARAREIYEMNSIPQTETLMRMAEFVTLFGVFHRQCLLDPLATCWRNGKYQDESFAVLVRALMVESGTTSALLDELSVRELIEMIRRLPRQALMTQKELELIDGLSGKIEVFRGGWAQSPQDLVGRGVSWSLCREVANDFVSINMSEAGPGDRPFLLRTSIRKADVVAYFAPEYEVIVDSIVIIDWQTNASKQVDMYQKRANWLASVEQCSAINRSR